MRSDGSYLQQDSEDGIVLPQLGILDNERQRPGQSDVQPEPSELIPHARALTDRLLQVHCRIQGLPLINNYACRGCRGFEPLVTQNEHHMYQCVRGKVCRVAQKDTGLLCTCYRAAGEHAALLCIRESHVKGSLQISCPELNAVSVRSSQHGMGGAQEGLHGRTGQEEGLPQGVDVLLHGPSTRHLLHQGLPAPVSLQ